MKKLIYLAGLFLVQGCPLAVMCSENSLHSLSQNFAAPRTGADILETLKYFKKSPGPLGKEFYTFVNETVPAYHNLLDDESFSQVFEGILFILIRETRRRNIIEQAEIKIATATDSSQGYWQRVLKEIPSR